MLRGHQIPKASPNAMPPATLPTRRRNPHDGATFRSLHFFILLPLLLTGALSCSSQSNEESAHQTLIAAGGDKQHGQEVIDRIGCGSCHVIPGIAEARGRVGPPLGGIAKRSYVGGALPNTAPNMIAWIQHPQRIDPATVMPELGLTEAEARDVATYLYTLK